MATNIFVLLLQFLLLSAAAQPPAPAPQQPGCVDELVAFSPCLPFVCDPPNHATDTVPPQCCDVFRSAFESSDGYCFCYIFREPLMFGFPLNKERVDSLPSLCISNNGVVSLDSFCSSDAPALPPLPSTTDSGISNPSNSSFGNDSSYSPPEPAIKPPTPPMPSSSIEQTMFSSATNLICKHTTWFILGMMIFLFNLRIQS